MPEPDPGARLVEAAAVAGTAAAAARRANDALTDPYAKRAKPGSPGPRSAPPRR
ncbi:hypothetical protein [Pseudonocardia sp. Ae717_Ps2]|uniref:hypothetical protein n=1 Tax=Pseudonocardia sp. Ae717_Ps2 TaxID=1885573 RepID=UPI001301178B|nr:hypothetical protein [Pseudonocardia sp. Ae717_Ps2]